VQISQQNATMGAAPANIRPTFLESFNVFFKNWYTGWYRVIVNSFLATWLGTGLWAVAHHSLPLAGVYMLLIGTNLFFVALADCRTCPRRLGKCTHFYVGRLTKLLPPKKNSKPNPIAHMRVLAGWAVVHAIPQAWLWQQSKIMFSVFWLAPVLGVVFLRLVVCWQMCGNKQCPMNKTTHPLPWEEKKSPLVQILT